jgi:hypothetical protein
VFTGWCGIAAPASGAGVAAIVSSVPSLPVTAPGQTITVHGSGFPQSVIDVYLRLGSEHPGDKGTLVTGSASPDGTVVTFQIPSDTRDGTYLVSLGVGGQELAVPGDLRIVRDDSTKVALRWAWPATVYPKNGKPGFDFTLVGENLGNVPSDNEILKEGYGALPVGTEKECANPYEAERAGKVCLSYDPGMEGKRLNVSNCPPDICNMSAGFAIKVGRDTSDFRKVTFSKIGEDMLRVATATIFLALVAIVLALVWGGINNNKIAGQKNGVVYAFFLDRQTNSFSLSKLQVLLWTTVFVYSYVYLYLCRTFIQGASDFPQVPDNWPTLLGVSAGTTVAAAGITRFHGSKGSGPIHPSLADFVSSGGLVIGERFQFFIWTLIGCVGYFVIVLLADPASLSSLPDIKGPILTLMGVSSVGYLAGKYARLPGPIIDLLTILTIGPDANDLTKIVMILQIKGQNLSDSAVIKIDDAALRIDEFDIEGATAQDQPSGSNFFSLLTVTIRNADRYRMGKHVLFLINEDGQSACVSFPMNPLTLNQPGAVEENDQPVTVTLTGSNICGSFTGSWANPRQTMSPAPPVTIVVAQDSNSMDVTFTPGPAGSGTLTVTSLAQLETAVDIIVTPRRNLPPAPV